MKLSIITINYNNKTGLAKTFESVFSQADKNFEYIVIDGGSNDGSKELIEQRAGNIDYWISEKDNGIYNAMNKGIAAASGEYLLFLNSGDELYDKYVVHKFAGHNAQKRDLLIGKIKFVNSKGNLVHSVPASLDLDHFFISSLPHPATFIRRSSLVAQNGFDESFKIISDWKFFMLAICRHKCSFEMLDFIISNFYEDGISSTQQELALKERAMVFEKEFPDYFRAAKRAEKAESLLEQRRFQYLSQIEKYSVSRKITTLVLKLLTFLRM